MRQAGGLVGQHGLRLVEFGALQGAEAAHLVHRQFAEQGEEAADVAVVAVAPELPEVERRQALGVQPHRALRRLAHLAAVAGGQQRHGQAVQLRAVLAARQLDAVDDVGPLIGAADLQGAAVAARQLGEVVGLQQGVAELEERQRMLQAAADGVVGEQAVDAEMAADQVEEVEVAEAVQPVGVVHHGGVLRAVAQMQVAPEGALDAGDVGGDGRLVEHRPAAVAEARVADARGGPADQQQRPVPGLLQPAHQHQALQVADVQTVGGGIEAEVGGQRASGQGGAQAVGVGALVDEATLFEQGQQVGIRMGHCSLLGEGETPEETLGSTRSASGGSGGAHAYRLGEVR
ncbi:hypothetical protein D3C80_1097030 [compost metagenome]